MVQVLVGPAVMERHRQHHIPPLIIINNKLSADLRHGTVLGTRYSLLNSGITLIESERASSVPESVELEFAGWRRLDELITAAKHCRV